MNDFFLFSTAMHFVINCVHIILRTSAPDYFLCNKLYLNGFDGHTNKSLYCLDISSFISLFYLYSLVKMLLLNANCDCFICIPCYTNRMQILLIISKNKKGKMCLIFFIFCIFPSSPLLSTSFVLFNHIYLLFFFSL